MVLSDQEIIDALQKKEIIIDPYDKESLQPASYDLKVGPQAFSDGKLVDLSSKRFIKIQRGDFAVLTTTERIRCGLTITGKFGLRSYFARRGLILLPGIQIDPGYEGTLTAFVFNLGPEAIVIQYQETFATVEFSRSSKPASKGYGGPYQGQTGIPLRDLASLVRSRRPMSLREMQEILTRLDERYRLLGRLTFTIISAMVAVFVGLIALAFYIINLLLPIITN